MMKNEMKTNNKTVLLAILAVFAMVAAGAAVVMASTEDVEAADATGVVAAPATISAAGNYYVGVDMMITLNGEDADANIYVLSGVEVTFKGAADNAVDIIVYQVTAAPVSGTIAEANIVGDTHTTTVTVNDLGSAKNLTFTAKLDSSNKSVSTVSGTVPGATIAKDGGKIKVAADGKLVSVAVIENLDSNAVLTEAAKTTYIGDLSEPIALAADTNSVSITSGTATVTCGANEALAALTKANGGALVLTRNGDANPILEVSGALAAANSLTATSGSMKITAVAGILGTVTGTTETAAALANNVVVSADIKAGSTVIRGYYTAPSKITESIKVLGTLTVAKTLTFGDKTTPKSITILPDAYMDVWASVKGVGEATIIADGDYTGHKATLAIRQGASFSGITVGNVAGKIDIKDMPASFSISELSGDVTTDIANGIIATGKTLTIPQGETVTVTGMLALNGEILYVNGTLIIAEGAQIGSTNTEANITADPETTYNAIIVGSKGSIVNNGTLGKDLAVAVGTSNTSYVELNGVQGLKMAVSSTSIDLSGDISMIADTLYPATIETTGATITKGLTVPKDVTLNIISATLSSTLDVKGTVVLGNDVEATATALKLKAGAKIVVTGTLYEKTSGALDANKHGQIKAYITTPGEDLLSDVTITTPTAVIDTIKGVYDMPLPAEDIIFSASGYTISVVKYTYIDDNGDSKYYQRAEISGSLAASVAKPTAATATTAAKFDLAGGFFFVNEDDELVSTSDAVAMTATGKLIVEGGFKSKTAPGNTFIGAHYTIGGDTENPVRYVVNYNAGLIAIAAADDNTITLVGLAGYEYDLAGDYALPADYVIGAAGDGSLVIPEDVSFTVMAGATFDPDALAAISGRLIVMADGVCDNVPDELYAVYSEDASGNMKYCGFQTALNDATAGDTITVVRNVELDSLTVPAGVTVEVEAGTFAVKKSLIVSNEAKFVTGGNFNMGTAQNKNSRVTVYGTLDATAGTCTFTGVEDYEMVIESTGQFIYKTSQAFVNTKLVGAVYKDGTSNVLTTLANAIEEGATAITIAQDYNSSDLIELDGVTLTVNADTKVTLGAVDVSGGSIVVLGEGAHVGKITATIGGTVGEDDDATVIVSSFTGTISDKAKNGVYTLSLDAMTAGSLSVTSGILAIGADAITIGADNFLTVSSDADLVNTVNTIVNNAGSFNVAGSLIVADGTLTVQTAADGEFNIYGILDVDGAMVIEDNDGGAIGANVANISGLVYVDGQLTIEGFTLTGIMYINDDADSTASATFRGNVMLGESSFTGAEASIDGKNLVMDDEHYILAYAGAEIDDQIVEKLNLKTTSFFINDALYATAFAITGNAIKTVTADATGVINVNTVIVVPGFNMDGLTDVTNWTNALGVKYAAIPNVGAAGAELMYFSGEAGFAKVTVSVATGMSIYVDGVKYASGTTINNVALGAHTVMVTVNPGYKYADGTTATITFNGKVLSGLLVFEITPDMVGEDVPAVVLSAIGDIVVDQPDIPEQEKEDNSMIMILLGVLVVMVVILAIVTVIRMMRS